MSDPMKPLSREQLQQFADAANGYGGDERTLQTNEDDKIQLCWGRYNSTETAEDVELFFDNDCKKERKDKTGYTVMRYHAEYQGAGLEFVDKPSQYGALLEGRTAGSPAKKDHEKNSPNFNYQSTLGAQENLAKIFGDTQIARSLLLKPEALRPEGANIFDLLKIPAGPNGIPEAGKDDIQTTDTLEIYGPKGGWPSGTKLRLNNDWVTDAGATGRDPIRFPMNHPLLKEGNVLDVLSPDGKVLLTLYLTLPGRAAKVTPPAADIAPVPPQEITLSMAAVDGLSGQVGSETENPSFIVDMVNMGANQVTGSIRNVRLKSKSINAGVPNTVKASLSETENVTFGNSTVSPVVSVQGRLGASGTWELTFDVVGPDGKKVVGLGKMDVPVVMGTALEAQVPESPRRVTSPGDLSLPILVKSDCKMNARIFTTDENGRVSQTAISQRDLPGNDFKGPTRDSFVTIDMGFRIPEGLDPKKKHALAIDFTANRQRVSKKIPLVVSEVKPAVIVLPPPDQGVVERFEQSIRYATNKSKVLGSHTPSLERSRDLFRAELDSSPTKILYVYGHTDSTGRSGYNFKLSGWRAQGAKNYLIDNGLGAYEGRIQIVALGPDNPRYDNNTPEGRRKNRSVEFRVVETNPGAQPVAPAPVAPPPPPAQPASTKRRRAAGWSLDPAAPPPAVAPPPPVAPERPTDLM